MAEIDRFDFDIKQFDEIAALDHWGENVGNDWPVVYLINNSKEAYVGETVNAKTRFEQHMQNPERRRLTEVRIVSDQTFNKSVILDLEAFLIKHMGADGKYTLQNGNGGLHDHEYYNRSGYEKKFNDIWNQLMEIGVVEHSITDIENSEIFKYSPFKSLGAEQYAAEQAILKTLADIARDGGNATILINGGAGTGKTILAIYLMKLLADDIEKDAIPVEDMDEDETVESVAVSEAREHIEKIGIVMPQKTLQASVKDVFGSVKSLNKSMVLSPADVVKDYVKTGKKYDLLIVDEAHRLKCRYKGHLSSYTIFDKCNELLGLDKEKGTELDWIFTCSKNRIIFRDGFQTVRPCDIDDEDFSNIVHKRYDSKVVHKELTTQWRCLGGNDYIYYMRDILSEHAESYKDIKGYDLKLYDNCAEMVSDIKQKNAEMDLCRVVAGYAWKWDRKKPDQYTITIQGQKYRWNRTYENWINTETAIDEIGCIHTIQGYDLNYVGVIIGPDLKYDKEHHHIYADKKDYFDQQGKSGVANDQDELTRYITNIYLTLLTRGIKGTYVYVCDDALREFFKRFLPVSSK